MKTKEKNWYMKALAKVSAWYLLVQSRATYLVYCDAFDDAAKGVKSLQTKFTTLAEVLFPLAIVICAICMFFTRDQRKFETERSIMIGCVLAYALIVLVNKGNLVSTIKGLF